MIVLGGVSGLAKRRDPGLFVFSLGGVWVGLYAIFGFPAGSGNFFLIYGQHEAAAANASISLNARLLMRAMRWRNGESGGLQRSG